MFTVKYLLKKNSRLRRDFRYTTILYTSTLNKHFIQALYQSTLRKHFIKALYKGITTRYYKGITTRYYDKVLQRYHDKVLRQGITTSLFNLLIGVRYYEV